MNRSLEKISRFLLIGSITECILFALAIAVSLYVNASYQDLIDKKLMDKESILSMNEKASHMRECFNALDTDPEAKEDIHYEIESTGYHAFSLSTTLNSSNDAVKAYANLFSPLQNITSDSGLMRVKEILYDATFQTAYGNALFEIQREVLTEKNNLELLKKIQLVIVLFAIPFFVATITLCYKRTRKDAESLLTATKKAASKDALTGLYNRAYTEKEIEKDIKVGAGNAFLYMMDMDNFKSVNDTYGHIAGDNVLKCFSKVLRSVSRENDICCRIGGDEFILYCRNVNRDQAESIAKRILSSARKRLAEVEGGQKVTLSVGVAPINKDSKSFKEVYDAADECLYQIKKNGKNDYIFTDQKKE